MIQLVPEERPSLKGNVIDLAPGPENYSIPAAASASPTNKRPPHIDHVIGPEGTPWRFWTSLQRPEEEGA
jgi:hypothetical protein